LVAQVNATYLPNKVLQLARPGTAFAAISPLLQGKSQVDGKPTAYVCQNFTCSPPVTSRNELQALLEN
jgi:uncharacterized protein YyaL (SSP411 family)